MIVGGGPGSPVPASDLHSEEASCPPCWTVQAQRRLAQAEAELRLLQERQAADSEKTKQGVERAILGARGEERRLLERVEQDHRDAQRRLEQVQRDNMAAARVGRSLLEQRLRQVALLQQRIRNVDPRSAEDRDGFKRDQVMKEVTEFLQPWEISVSLKKVGFKPSPQPHAVVFGEIHVQDHTLLLQAGGCGPQGRVCALHSQEVQPEDTGRQKSATASSPSPQDWTSPTARVVKKINLSTWCDPGPEEEPAVAPKIRHWPPTSECRGCHSPQHEEIEASSLQPHGEDLFLVVPEIQEWQSCDGRPQVSRGARASPGNKRRPAPPAASRRNPSPSPERRQKAPKVSRGWSLDRKAGDTRKKTQDANVRLLRGSSRLLTSPGSTCKEPLTSQSCLDLTFRGRPHSRLSQSSDEPPLGTMGDAERAPSPTDSLDSSYTFIISPPQDSSPGRATCNYSCSPWKSSLDLTHRNHPLIGTWSGEPGGTCRVRSSTFSANSSSRAISPPRASDRQTSHPYYQVLNTVHLQERQISESSEPPRATRPSSVSVTDGSSEGLKAVGGESGEEKDPDSSAVREVRLIGQFGKQGSGRADLTLPSGIHVSAQGQLFIVDCGNARLQVTDPLGNVLQQVIPPNSEGSARRCRNYFDVAVNSKGLLALSCAAERVLLVFNRHGRLLQTFGGSGPGSVKDQLEAPRGVTVTRLDEFLVADVRRGTLVALKLDQKTGSRSERTVVTGFHRPYLVAACLSSGMMAVSERGGETGRVPCIKVLDPGWTTVRVLGVCSAMGPVLECPWGICMDRDGDVLVADWGRTHRVVLYPPRGVGRALVTRGLSSPRGLALLPEGLLAVSDSMNHCIKIFCYKSTGNQNHLL